MMMDEVLRKVLFSILLIAYFGFSHEILNAAQDENRLGSNEVHAKMLSDLYEKMFYKVEIEKVINVEFNSVPLDEALNYIAGETGLKLTYRGDNLVDKRITLKSEGISVSDALSHILNGTELDYLVSSEGYLLISKVDNGNNDLIQQSISGQVTDSETGELLPGVNIVIQGTTSGTTTGADGTFDLSVSSLEQTLIISYIGYERREINIDGRTNIDIELTPSIIAGDELVVIGYGTQERVNLTGSVATVTAEFIADRPLTNASQAIQGMQGVYVNQYSSQPGADDATLRIRGVGTLGNNNPLVLVDGVEQSLSDVNPADIDNISVLKDAAAASIYGNRAANGVVLITTKTGQRDQPLQVEYNAYYGWQQATYLPDMMLDPVRLMEVYNEGYTNEGIAPPFSQAEIEEYRNGIGTNPDIYPSGTDWYDIIYGTAPMHDHNLRLSGGGNRTTYSVNLGYMDQEGIMVATEAQKYSFSGNMTFDVNDDMTLGFRLSSTYWDRTEPSRGADGLEGNVTRALPYHPNILSNGEYGDTWLVTPGHNLFRHPLATAQEGYRATTSHRLLGNVFLDYELPFNIQYRVNLSANTRNQVEHRWTPEVFIYNPKEPDVPKLLRFDQPIQRSAWRFHNENLDVNFNQTLNWREDITSWSRVDVLLGFSRETFSSSGFNARREGYFGNELHDIGAGSINPIANGSSSESALMSYFGRANYNIDDRYLFEFNFRYDGSSRFAKGNRWGFFPSVSASWRINEEPFMQGIEVLSDLRLRASWGELGNQNIDLYQFASTVNINQGTSFNNILHQGAAVTSLSDQDISWEKTTITNLGLNMGFWDNRLEFAVDAFNKETTDILANINIPAQVGNLGGPTTNLYSMRNRGLEVSANYINFISSDFGYRIGGSITYIDNEVTSLAGDVQHGNNTVWGTTTIIQEGYPVDSFYLLQADGIFRSQAEIDNYVGPDGTPIQPNAVPGDIRYIDVTGDGRITSDDRVVTGRSVPKYTYSFTLGLDYRNFDMEAFFQGVYGINTYPTRNIVYPIMNGAGITNEQMDYWTPENTDAKFPRIGLPFRGSQVNYQLSDFWLHDASYLRLKNLRIGYTILTQRANINRLRVFANAQNLLTFSPFTVFDPERQITRANVGEYPTAKTFSIGVNLAF